MKLVQTREALLEVLQATLGAVEKRHTAPILENVLLRIQQGQTYWRGTDLELEIAMQLPSLDSTDGLITLPARKLADICKSLANESLVHIESMNEQRARVTSGRSRFELATLPATDFPELEDIGDLHSFELPENVFKRLLDRAAYAMANQDVRYYLNGMVVRNGEIATSNGDMVLIIKSDGIKSDGEYIIDNATLKMIVTSHKGIKGANRVEVVDSTTITGGSKISINRLTVNPLTLTE